MHPVDVVTICYAVFGDGTVGQFLKPNIFNSFPCVLCSLYIEHS